jgi:hypothetical protein
VSLIETAPSRQLDPLQSVLAHMPNGMYGLYEGLCMYMWVDPAVPTEIKEGLRFYSAATIGCAYCQTVREQTRDGARLLPDSFYAGASSASPRWEELVGDEWAPVFEMAAEVLRNDVVRPQTMERLRRHLDDTQIVESLFFLLVIGASHRFSRAVDVEQACLVPTRLEASEVSTEQVAGPDELS